MTVTPTKDYVELIEEVVGALQALIADVVEDYATQETKPTQEEEDSDDEFGSRT